MLTKISFYLQIHLFMIITELKNLYHQKQAGIFGILGMITKMVNGI